MQKPENSNIPFIRITYQFRNNLELEVTNDRNRDHEVCFQEAQNFKENSNTNR